MLKENDLRARHLRERFQRAGVGVISLVSSTGSGKTALLESLLTDLRRAYRVGALVGDLATENDAVRLARSGAPVKSPLERFAISMPAWSRERLRIGTLNI